MATIDQLLREAYEGWDGLLETSARALERFPDEETAMQFRGQALREKGDADRAIGWLQRAIGAKPSFAGVRVDLGKLYESEGKTALAEETFRELPVANPDYPIAPVSLAMHLGRQGQWEEAERILLDPWEGLGEMWRGAVRQNPQAKELLARDAVKAVVGEAQADAQDAGA